MSISGDSNGPDEQIDFDALWAWGNATPAVGSPKMAPVAEIPAMSTSAPFAVR